MSVHPVRHVAIVGAGAIGLCAAYACRRDGAEVTVVDPSDGAGLGATPGNAGLITPSHVVPLAAPGMPTLGLRYAVDPSGPFGLAWNLRPEFARFVYQFLRSCTSAHVERSAPVLHRFGMQNREAWLELLEDTGIDCGLQQRGLAMICRTQRMLEAERRLGDRAAALGQRVGEWSEDEVSVRFPGMGLQSAGAIWFAEDMHGSPDRIADGLRACLRERGVRFHDAAAATAWRIQGKRILALETTAGRVEADRFVVAAGMGSPALLAKAGLRLLLEAGKGYSLTLEQPPVLPDLPALLVEARLAVTPMSGRLRVAGTMELGDAGGRFNRRRIEGIRAAFRAFCPGYPAEALEAVEPWMGHRPCTPDGLPYIGPTQAAENLLVACGHAMLGLTLAPVTGQWIAACCRGESVPEWASAAVAVDRFRSSA